LTKEDRDKLSLGNFVKTIQEAMEARTHLMREWALLWVLAPLLYAMTLTCLVLIVADAFSWIHQMRDGLLSIIKIVLGSEAFAGTIGAGFGWLFDRKSKSQHSAQSS